MAEYIELKALIAELSEEFSVITPFYTSEQKEYFDRGMCCAVRCIERQPTADVVEVVRCCECQYWESRNSINSHGICRCGNMEMNYCGEFYPMRNDFCSYGVAKMDGKGDG